MPSNFWGCILLATWQSLPSCKFYVKFGLSLQSFLQLKKHKCVKPPPIQRSRTRKFLDLHVRCLETQKKSNKNTINKSKLWGKKKIRIESSPSETTRPWTIRFPHKKKTSTSKRVRCFEQIKPQKPAQKKQTKPSWPKKGHNKSTNLDLPSMKLTCSPLKMDGLWDDPFLLGGNAFFQVLLLFLFVSGRVDMSLPFFSEVCLLSRNPKKSSATWVFPKIMVPQNHPILIGFSILFTIHFGGPPLLLETPTWLQISKRNSPPGHRLRERQNSLQPSKGWGKPLAGWWLSFNPVGKYAQVKLGGNLPQGSGWT